MLPENATKKRKVAKEAESDKMDPVEKLLSLTCTNDLVQMNECESLKMEASQEPIEEPASHPNISNTFSRIMNDNLMRHYSKLRRSQMEIHNDNSSFSILNRPKETPDHEPRTRAPQIPFFKNVNFNSSPTFEYKVEDYIHYDEDEENEPLTTDSEVLHTDTEEEACSPLEPAQKLASKMSFHYRQNDNLNFSLTGEKSREPDAFKFLNKRSVISGKASEMIGTSNFLVSDFFF